MPIGSQVIYNPGDLILSVVSSSGDTFKETKIAAATSSVILFNNSGSLASASLNSLTVGNAISSSYALTASYVLGGGGSGTVTGSTNYIAKFTSPTSVGTSSIYESGSKVGIGTTDAYQLLTVNGIIEAGANSSTNGGPALYIKYNGIANDYINTIGSEYSSGDMVLGFGITGKSGTAGYISTFDNFTGHRGALKIGAGTLNFLNSRSSLNTAVGSDVAMTSSLYIANDGLIGISKTNPSYVLDISGSVRADEGEIIATGNNAAFRIYRTTGINYLDWASGQNLYLGTVTSAGGAGRSNKMVVLNTGNVGIATTAPATTLQVGTQTSGDNNDYAISVIRHGTLGAPGTWSINQPALKVSDLSGNGPSSVDTDGLFSIQLPRLTYTNVSASNVTTFAISFDTSLGSTRIDGKGNHWIGYDRSTSLVNSSSFNALIYNGLAVGSNYQTISLSNGQAIFAGNVGIGTTSPSFLLDVSGSSRHGYRSADTHQFTGSVTLNGSLYTNANITASNISASGTGSFGIVGIGTANPSYKLHVVGNVYGTTTGQFGNAVITGTGTGYAVYGSNAGATGVKINLDSDITRNDLVISASTGYVGIGTSNPASRLSVGSNPTYAAGVALVVGTPGNPATTGTSQPYANLRLGTNTGNSQVLDFGIYDAIPYGSWIQAAGGGNLAFPSQLVLNPTGGSIAIGTTSPTGSLHIENTTSTIPILSLGGGVASLDSSDLYVLNSFNTGSGVGFAAKVIGINISGSLTEGNIPLQRTVWSGVSSATAIVLSADDPGSGTDDNAFQIWTTHQGTAGTALTQKFTLTSAGEVGIGVTTPSTLLQLKGDAASHQIFSINRSGSATPAVYIGNDSSNNALIASNNTNIRFGKDFTGTFNEYVRIDTSGNVGIGTSSPAELLDIAASTDSDAVAGPKINFKKGASSKAVIGIGGNYLGVATNTNDLVIRNDAGSILFGFNGTERMRITGSNGNVGIGTTNPRNQLTVIGAAQNTSAISDSGVTGGTIFIGSSTNNFNNGGTLLFSTINDGGTYLPQWGIKTLFQNGAGNGVSDLAFSTRITGSATSLSEVVRFRSDGNIGIGTTSPSYQLDVYKTSNDAVIRS